jgi:hypothetical protein
LQINTKPQDQIEGKGEVTMMTDIDRGCVTEFFDICERRGISIFGVSKIKDLYGVWIESLEGTPIAIGETPAQAVTRALQAMRVTDAEIQQYAAERYAEGK